MAKMPQDVINDIEKQELFVVATSSKDGTPNVAYVKFLKVLNEETILIADNYFEKTRDNILNNGKIAFAVRDEQKGSYQIKGSAKRYTDGDYFDMIDEWVPDKLPKEAAVVMKVEQIYNGAKSVDKY